MDFDAWLTLAVIAAVFAALAWGRVGTDVVMVGGVGLLMLAGVLTPGEALHGMSNEGMITVGVMYVVVCGLMETGGVTWAGQKLLGRPRSVVGAQLRMLLPVTALSAFMNNTPLVAMFIPVIDDWCRKCRLSPSKLMIPLSYAAILGGTCTLIGTSTNLVVKGLWDDAAAGLDGARALGFFEIGWAGVPCAAAGVLFILLFSRRLLPDRKPVLSEARENARSYAVEMVVDAGSPLVGRSIEQAGLRHLPGLFLAEIERDGVMLPAVGPDERLAAGDRLTFVGVVGSIADLQKIRGLKPAGDQVSKLAAPRPQRGLIEAVVSSSSPMVGRSIREGRFRNVYNAVVLAVARGGERLNMKVGDIVLRPGDQLLVEAHRSFVEQHRHSRDFLLVSPVENSSPPRHERAPLALAILLLMVALATIEPLHLTVLHAAMIAAGLMIVTRCCSGSAARKSVDWMVLVTIAAGLALSTALEKSGAARAIAERVIALAGGSPLGTLAAVYFITMVFTNLITNNAAAALVFPIALAAAGDLGADPRPFAIAIMMAASACYATPIGYQTNLMVMGPGGYRFSDYLRIGVPLNLFLMGVGLLIIPAVWPLTGTR